jgi:hypothetical protein
MSDRLVAIAFCRSVAEHGDETHAGLRVRVVTMMHALLLNLTMTAGSRCRLVTDVDVRPPDLSSGLSDPGHSQQQKSFPPKSGIGEKCQSGGFPRVG